MEKRVVTRKEIGENLYMMWKMGYLDGVDTVEEIINRLIEDEKGKMVLYGAVN